MGVTARHHELVWASAVAVLLMIRLAFYPKPAVDTEAWNALATRVPILKIGVAWIAVVAATAWMRRSPPLVNAAT